MSPYILSQIPIAVGVALLLIISAVRGKNAEKQSLAVTALALAASIFYTARLGIQAEYFGGAIRVTQSTQVLACVILVLFLFSVLSSHGYAAKVGVDPVDWRLIVLFMAAGAVHVVLAGDIATLFVAFELVSIPSYALAGFSRHDRRSNEAGMKYLILGLVGSALFLSGLVFLYGATGSLDLGVISERVTEILSKPDRAGDARLVRLSVALLAGALFFKTAVAPLHGWLFDIYQGSSMLALSVIASPAKLASLALLGTLFNGPLRAAAHVWTPIFLIAAIVSFLVGGLQGLAQQNLKRIVAASSVMNAGFILLAAVYAPGTAFVLYLTAYGLGTSTLTCVFMYFGSESSDVDEVEDIAGLARTALPMGLASTIALLSLGGFPITAGFLAKFSVLAGALKPISSGLAGHLSVLGAVAAVAGALSAVLSFAFYLRLVRSLWFQPRGEPRVLDTRWNYALPALAGSFLVLVLGTVPSALGWFAY